MAANNYYNFTHGGTQYGYLNRLDFILMIYRLDLGGNVTVIL